MKRPSVFAYVVKALIFHKFGFEYRFFVFTIYNNFPLGFSLRFLAFKKIILHKTDR